MANPRQSSHPVKNIKGHAYQIGQRVRRRSTNSSLILFGSYREGEIVGHTWKKNKAGSVYPTYAVKFDNSQVIEKYILQMRLVPID